MSALSCTMLHRVLLTSLHILLLILVLILHLTLVLILSPSSAHSTAHSSAHSTSSFYCYFAAHSSALPNSFIHCVPSNTWPAFSDKRFLSCSLCSNVNGVH